ncbi:glycosyltransferase family protein [Emticicia agri]|uniref:Glycosyl transferase n=1 Tax=Emticicia agri TaxID=2492393 RepID=A0A4Q5M3D8_9BACT|nr:glycosyltransferase family protein [Emticicia agri]RYU96579.1 glycosyl transferase [Emticicia agri]
MRFLLIVQGEGRGHLTQAIALTEILENNGHTVVGALVGTAHGKDVSSFFSENFRNKIIPFASPYLAYCPKTKALDITKTITHTIFNLRGYLSSLKKIRLHTKELKPDIIINFYDVLGGIHQLLFRSKVPMVCIAHQYLLLHPNFHHPKNHWLDKLLVNTNTRITALGAAKKLALSFTPFADAKNQRIFAIPPLLRSDLSRLSTNAHNYLLAYVTQHSLAEQIMAWHDKNPGVEMHCFWDNPDYSDTYQYSPNLHFHKINGKKFLEMMQNCRGLVTTAGFESVCEAMYLGKPTFMIPVPKHYEQACNAIDASRAGAGISATSFDLTAFMNYLPSHKDISAEFKAWHSRSSFIFLREIESLFNIPERRTFRRLEVLPQLVKRLALSLVSPSTRS